MTPEILETKPKPNPYLPNYTELGKAIIGKRGEGLAKLNQVVNNPGQADQLVDRLNEAISFLKPRERKLIELKFGVEDGQPRSPQEIGAMFHVRDERIRYLINKGMRKLRDPSRNLASDLLAILEK